MMENRYMWVPCKIENSGFPSERRFEVDLPGNGGRVVGTAYIAYLQDHSGNSLTEDVPAYGESTAGKVQCRIVGQKGESMLVEFPGTDVFHVPSQALAAN